MSEQIPFGGDDFGAGLGFAENPEPRCPCILLLDTSGSMSGNPIIQLNEGLHSFKDELTADSLAAKRVEIALLTFGGQVQILYDFTSAQYFNPPAVTAGGATPMGAAILRACELFFAPLFKTLRDSPSADELAAPLRRFLDSPRVNERTDDDKSLIVATRPAVDAAPQII